MLEYLIDGNNLLGKIPHLKNLKINVAVEKLIFLIENSFVNKKVRITIFLDGYPLDVIKSKLNLVYSFSKSADEIIKEKIKQSRRNKNIIVISSDLEVYSFAKEYGCSAIKSEEFYKNYLTKKFENSEEKPSIGNIEEFKKLFNTD